MGVDCVRFANINFYSTDENTKIQQEWLPKNPKYRCFEKKDNKKEIGYKNLKPCFWLWRSAVINVNGGITPCCLYDTVDWGNVFNNDFRNEWNNKNYLQARLRSKKTTNKKRKIICDHCYASFLFK